MDRQELCKRIEQNLKDLNAELKFLREKEDKLRRDLDQLQRDHYSATLDSMAPSGGPGRQPKRRERIGIGLDVVTAIGQVLTDDSLDRLRKIEAQMAAKKRELADAEHRINQKVQVVQESQSKLTEFDCFDFRVSHELMNIRLAPREAD